VADEGQKYLPISDAMGRDIDAGRMGDRDITDFLPDSVAQEMWDQSRPGPVHAENLVPISREEAARRTMLEHDGRLPKMPAPRRVIPAPFKRDRITGGRHGKEWRALAAAGIRTGDIITGIGLVTDAEERVVYATRASVAEGTAQMHRLIAGPGGRLPQGHDPGDLVAIGTVIAVRGAGGNAAAYDPSREVRVFR
jgi:hypothetical protein